MSRRTIAVLILSIWLGSLGWLAERQYLGVGSAEESPRWPVPPGAAFHAVRLGDRQVGLGSLSVDTVPEGLRVIEFLTLELPPQEPGTRRRLSRRTEALYSRGLQLVSWASDELSEQGRQALRGRVTDDSLMTVIGSEDGTVVESLTVRLRRPVVLPSAVPLVAASRGLPKAGSKLNVEVYDPLDRELRIERLVVAAESVFVVPDSAEFSTTLNRWRVAHSDTVRAWRLEGDANRLPYARWIDAAGMTVRLVHPLGAAMDRSAFELVNTNFRAGPPPYWDTSSSAPDYQLRPGGVAATPATFAVELSLVPPEPLPDSLPALNGGWQRRVGDTLRIAPTDSLEPAPAEPRPGPPPVAPLDSAASAPALAIIPTDADAERTAQALAGWVRRAISPREGPYVRSPALVLSTRSGTAQEQVGLLVALLRVTGLPARQVWGVVRVEGRWQLRPWAEAWTGGWRPLDPALAAGEPVGRLRLAAGGDARLLDFVLAAGRLRFTALQETQ